MVLAKQTYNTQDEHKKPKDKHNKLQKLNLTKPNLTDPDLVAWLTTSGQDTYWAYSNKKSPAPGDHTQTNRQLCIT